MRLPKCPYCGKTVNPFYAWSIKGQGEYNCSQCGGFSDVKLAKPIYYLGLGAVILAGIILLIFIFTGSMQLYLLPMMLIPFLIFTAISPFFVRLKPSSVHRHGEPRPNSHVPAGNNGKIGKHDK